MENRHVIYAMELRKILENGLRFVAPVTNRPSANPPFLAIVEAADGKRRLTRRRFTRLVMSTGNGRRSAECLAFYAQRGGIPYREMLKCAMIPAIEHADEATCTLLHMELMQ